MDKLKLHWTEKSVGSFVHRLSFDFVTQIQKRLDKARISKREFASRLKVTPGRISQIFNDPGNLTLLSAVEYARRIGLKVALVAYDDGDPENKNGPVNSEIFSRCWHLQGCPKDFSELASVSAVQMAFNFQVDEHTSFNAEFDKAKWAFVANPEQYAVNKAYIGMVQ